MDWSLLALPGFLAWLIILILPWRPWSTRESLDADPALQADLSRVTVLIPARNEQDVIAETLDALATQGHGLRTILIDDQSTDATSAIAKQKNVENFKIINGQSVPPGWSGKLWALEQGRRQVNTEFILLLDADIQLQPGTIATLLLKLDQKQLDMVSLMARLRMKNFWEKLLMPAFVFFFKLLYPFHLSNSISQHVAAAAGGCILIKSSTLTGIGGFESLRECLIDDCALAKKIKNNGGRIWIGLTHSAISLRRYEHLQVIWNIVARTAFTQLHFSCFLLILCTFLMLAAFALPIIALVAPAIPSRILGILTLAIMFSCYLPVLKYYAMNPLWGLSLPVTGMLYLAMTWSSAHRYLFRTGARWKDRHYRIPGPK